MQCCCSKCSVISSETKTRRTCVTPLRSLATTDASGGVARQEKITHAHECPFYHYAQFPHPIAITYRGKKYSRIPFGQCGIWGSGIIAPPFLTSALSGQLQVPAASPPGKEPPVPIRYEAVRVPESIWALWRI
jgi:hypothetical protein